MIGPVYSYELPEFFASGIKDRKQDRYRFHLRDRLYTLVPSLFQVGTYFGAAAVVFWIWDYFTGTGISWQLFVIAILFTTTYVLLFPLLPTRVFSIKGVFLAVVFLVPFVLDYFGSGNFVSGKTTLLFYISFTLTFALFFSLSYTGNSGVSNYSLVRKETIRYLPVTFLGALASIALIVYKGVSG